MRVLNKYKLELRWKSVEYREGLAILPGAYFSGPVLKDTAQIRENDQLTLDLTTQHKIFIPDYYQAVLKWKTIEYKGENIYLGEASIQGKHVNSIERLRDTDWLLIDCKGHDEKVHAYNLVYWAEVRKSDGQEKYGD